MPPKRTARQSTASPAVMQTDPEPSAAEVWRRLNMVKEARDRGVSVEDMDANGGGASGTLTRAHLSALDTARPNVNDLKQVQLPEYNLRNVQPVEQPPQPKPKPPGAKAGLALAKLQNSVKKIAALNSFRKPGAKAGAAGAKPGVMKPKSLPVAGAKAKAPNNVLAARLSKLRAVAKVAGRGKVLAKKKKPAPFKTAAKVAFFGLKLKRKAQAARARVNGRASPRNPGAAPQVMVPGSPRGHAAPPPLPDDDMSDSSYSDDEQDLTDMEVRMKATLAASETLASVRSRFDSAKVQLAEALTHDADLTADVETVSTLIIKAESLRTAALSNQSSLILVQDFLKAVPQAETAVGMLGRQIAGVANGANKLVTETVQAVKTLEFASRSIATVQSKLHGLGELYTTAADLRSNLNITEAALQSAVQQRTQLQSSVGCLLDGSIEITGVHLTVLQRMSKSAWVMIKAAGSVAAAASELLKEVTAIANAADATAAAERIPALQKQVVELQDANRLQCEPVDPATELVDKADAAVKRAGRAAAANPMHPETVISTVQAATKGIAAAKDALQARMDAIRRALTASTENAKNVVVSVEDAVALLAVGRARLEASRDAANQNNLQKTLESAEVALAAAEKLRRIVVGPQVSQSLAPKFVQLVAAGAVRVQTLEAAVFKATHPTHTAMATKAQAALNDAHSRLTSLIESEPAGSSTAQMAQAELTRVAALMTEARGISAGMYTVAATPAAIERLEQHVNDLIKSVASLLNPNASDVSVKFADALAVLETLRSAERTMLAGQEELALLKDAYRRSGAALESVTSKLQIAEAGFGSVAIMRQVLGSSAEFQQWLQHIMDVSSTPQEPPGKVLDLVRRFAGSLPSTMSSITALRGLLDSLGIHASASGADLSAMELAGTSGNVDTIQRQLAALQASMLALDSAKLTPEAARVRERLRTAIADASNAVRAASAKQHSVEELGPTSESMTALTASIQKAQELVDAGEQVLNDMATAMLDPVIAAVLELSKLQATMKHVEHSATLPALDTTELEPLLLAARRAVADAADIRASAPTSAGGSSTTAGRAFVASVARASQAVKTAKEAVDHRVRVARLKAAQRIARTKLSIAVQRLFRRVAVLDDDYQRAKIKDLACGDAPGTLDSMKLVATMLVTARAEVKKAGAVRDELIAVTSAGSTTRDVVGREDGLTAQLTELLKRATDATLQAEDSFRISTSVRDSDPLVAQARSLANRAVEIATSNKLASLKAQADMWTTASAAHPELQPETAAGHYVEAATVLGTVALQLADEAKTALWRNTSKSGAAGASSLQLGLGSAGATLDATKLLDYVWVVCEAQFAMAHGQAGISAITEAASTGPQRREPLLAILHPLRVAPCMDDMEYGSSSVAAALLDTPTSLFQWLQVVRSVTPVTVQSMMPVTRLGEVGGRHEDVALCRSYDYIAQVGRMHAVSARFRDLLTDVRRRNMSTLPVEFGMPLKTAMKRATKALRSTQECLLSEAHRLRHGLTEQEVEEIEVAVRTADLAIRLFGTVQTDTLAAVEVDAAAAQSELDMGPHSGGRLNRYGTHSTVTTTTTTTRKKGSPRYEGPSSVREAAEQSVQGGSGRLQSAAWMAAMAKRYEQEKSTDAASPGKPSMGQLARYATAASSYSAMSFAPYGAPPAMLPVSPLTNPADPRMSVASMHPVMAAPSMVGMQPMPPMQPRLSFASMPGMGPGMMPMGSMGPGMMPMGSMGPGMMPMGSMGPGMMPMGSMGPGMMPMGSMGPGMMGHPMMHPRLSQASVSTTGMPMHMHMPMQPAQPPMQPMAPHGASPPQPQPPAAGSGAGAAGSPLLARLAQHNSAARQPAA